MPKALVECIPNFSEARRPEVVAEIARSIGSVAEVHLLDRHSDLDHNRTVLTFVGPPVQVEEAAFRAIARAAELIDLDQHRGEHPRIGATDVVPFVPISGIDMQACVEMARRLGRRVGDELSLPVYLYEEAATRPDRQNLENIRRGQYEALKEEIGVKPERAPDFGPRQVGPAGATVIGARHPLIAYNVYLTTQEVAIAKKIAKAIRFSSGGLRFVKALGLLVKGRAQVSMNLTNFRETPVARVVEMIRREAERYRVGVHHSELVGLIPEEALLDAATWYLQLDEFDAEQVLERRLASAIGQGRQSLLARQPEAAVELTPAVASAQNDGSETGDAQARADGFLDALAEGTAAPGGGSAAAYAGALASALAAMVARLTIGKAKYASVEAQMASLLAEAESLRAGLAGAVWRDAAAFEAVMAAYRLPRGTPDEQQARTRAIETATLRATAEPLGAARQTVRVMELLSQVIRDGNRNAITDAACGLALAKAGLAGARLNVQANLRSLPDTPAASQMAEDLRSLEARAAEVEREAGAALQARAGLVMA